MTQLNAASPTSSRASSGRFLDVEHGGEVRPGAAGAAGPADVLVEQGGRDVPDREGGADRGERFGLGPAPRLVEVEVVGDGGRILELADQVQHDRVEVGTGHEVPARCLAGLPRGRGRRIGRGVGFGHGGGAFPCVGLGAGRLPGSVVAAVVALGEEVPQVAAEPEAPAGAAAPPERLAHLGADTAGAVAPEAVPERERPAGERVTEGEDGEEHEQGCSASGVGVHDASWGGFPVCALVVVLSASWLVMAMVGR
jgi:hypothetical protein